jgi:hypothetical protein
MTHDGVRDLAHFAPVIWRRRREAAVRDGSPGGRSRA